MQYLNVLNVLENLQKISPIDTIGFIRSMVGDSIPNWRLEISESGKA